MSEIQISKTLLILKSNANSTMAAEQFLRNREWVVFSTTNLKDFLTHIIQKKPSFVMISVDHPNKKVLMMPKVLTQSFPVCVFAFAENSSSVSFRKLQDIQCPYRINPPATGPAIERTVNKYLRDQEKKLRGQDEKPTLDSNGKPITTTTADGKTVIQSGVGSGDGSNAEVGGWHQAASVFSQLLEGEDGGKGGHHTMDGDSGSAGTMVAKGDKASEGNGSWIPSDPITENKSAQAGSLNGFGGAHSNGSSQGQNHDGSPSGFLNGDGGGNPGSATQGSGNDLGKHGHLGGGDYSETNEQGSDGTEGNSTPGSLGGAGKKQGPKNAQAGSLSGSEGFNGNDNDQNEGGSLNRASSHGGQAGQLGGQAGKVKKPGHSSKTEYNENEFDDGDQPGKLEKGPKNIQTGNNKKSDSNPNAGEGEDYSGGRIQRPKKYDKEQKTITILGKNSSSELESIILKGTKQALDDTVEVLDGEVNQELEDSSQVACIVVESEKFNGYLIAALGKNRKMDGKFVKAIQDRLFKFLKDNGEKVSDKDNLNLKIKKVEFEDWAVEYADFLKKSVHNGEEIAMAFFPVANVRPEIGESAASTMASVKLNEIQGDKVVEFNMYVYLPSNKKYILYTPKGGKFYGNQKGRLEEKGVKEVHMLKSEVNDLSKYKAQNYLNDLIENYKKKKTDPSKVA